MWPTKVRTPSQLTAVIAALAVGVLAGCGGGGGGLSGIETTAEYPRGSNQRQAGVQQPQGESEGVFGKDGLKLFGGGEDGEGGGGSGVPVNAWLWEASVDSVMFMPLTTADPFGGMLVTDWYTPPESPNERFKIQVKVGTELRADGVKATVFRQQRDPTGSWIQAPVDPQTNRDFEDLILTRARQLRVQSAER